MSLSYLTNTCKYYMYIQLTCFIWLRKTSKIKNKCSIKLYNSIMKSSYQNYLKRMFVFMFGVFLGGDVLLCKYFL